MRISVTFETITDASAADGDAADLGWIDPIRQTERSHRKGGKRITERNVRMARAGKFDWTSLRDALEWLEDNAPGPLEGQVDSRLEVRAIADGRDIVVGKRGYEYASSHTNYAVHVDGVSAGTLARLARLLEANGVRF